MRAQKSKVTYKYELERSPLYGLSSKKKLASLLGVEVNLITNPDKSKLTSQYRIFVDKKTRRFITEPFGDLLTIHRRLLHLFTRIAPPEYVHSAIKKRSYHTNAKAHRESPNILKIDIKKFFPSIKFTRIHSFFLNTLNCSPDIATILAKLCTVKTNKYGSHLPTGSCISPILSFLANIPLFDVIKAICKKNNCILTLYVDDITISGQGASPSLLTLIAMEIYNQGYEYHKIKSYKNEPATITGLIVHNGDVKLPDERAKKIRELRISLEISTGPLRNKLLASLIGRLSEAAHINPQYKVTLNRVISKYRTEWDQVVASRSKKAKLCKLKQAKISRSKASLSI